MQKNNNLLKTKIILKIKMSAKGGLVFAFILPGGLDPGSVTAVSYATASAGGHCSVTTMSIQ